MTALLVVNDLERLIGAKFEAQERSREQSFALDLLLGVIRMGIIFLVGLGLAVLYGGFR